MMQHVDRLRSLALLIVLLASALMSPRAFAKDDGKLSFWEVIQPLLSHSGEASLLRTIGPSGCDNGRGAVQSTPLPTSRSGGRSGSVENRSRPQIPDLTPPCR